MNKFNSQSGVFQSATQSIVSFKSKRSLLGTNNENEASGMVTISPEKSAEHTYAPNCPNTTSAFKPLNCGSAYIQQHSMPVVTSSLNDKRKYIIELQTIVKQERKVIGQLQETLSNFSQKIKDLEVFERDIKEKGWANASTISELKKTICSEASLSNSKAGALLPQIHPFAKK